MTADNSSQNLGSIIRQQRIAAGLTLGELSVRSGVSPSHLGRAERGERFPSSHILQRIARPSGFEESELFALADYLSPQPATAAGIIMENSVANWTLLRPGYWLLSLVLILYSPTGLYCLLIPLNVTL